MTGKNVFLSRRLKWKLREHWANCVSRKALSWGITLEFSCRDGWLWKPFIVQCAFFFRGKPDLVFVYNWLEKDQLMGTLQTKNAESNKQAKYLVITNAGMVSRYLFVSLRWFFNQLSLPLCHSAPVGVLI